MFLINYVYIYMTENEEQPTYFENFDMENFVSPVNADVLEHLLVKYKYNPDETAFLVDGFRNGFDIGYRGITENIQRKSPNLKLRIGSETALWNKVMKEVKAKRYIGPFDSPPFKDFIQSPIGLVPKDGGKDTRLIFHLSYPRGGLSINSQTPKHLTKVIYPSFDEAIRMCIKAGRNCSASKSDMKSAFRILGIKKLHWCLLVLMARSPFDGQIYWFADKNLPFGAAISCSHFQRFSNAIAYLTGKRIEMNQDPLNYLDDFLFVALLKYWCDAQLSEFLKICEEIGFPVSLEKTFWGATRLIFLGLLIDTYKQIVSIPAEKVIRAVNLITEILSGRKTTVKILQRACGYLNFLCKCIVPGRAFTRRLYSHYSPLMKPYHHVNVNQEMRADLTIWLDFLKSPEAYCRPFMDFSRILTAQDLDWFTDASGVVGYGGIHNGSWFAAQWDKQFLLESRPSIQYQELFAVAVSVILWANKYQNQRICLFVDNKSVRDMINSSTSGCKNCMVLIRMIVMHCMKWNVRIFAKYIPTKENSLADALSRAEPHRFWSEVKRQNLSVKFEPDEIPEHMWPVQKIWKS